MTPLNAEEVRSLVIAMADALETQGITVFQTDPLWVRLTDQFAGEGAIVAEAVAARVRDNGSTIALSELAHINARCFTLFDDLSFGVSFIGKNALWRLGMLAIIQDQIAALDAETTDAGKRVICDAKLDVSSARHDPAVFLNRSDLP